MTPLTKVLNRKNGGPSGRKHRNHEVNSNEKITQSHTKKGEKRQPSPDQEEIDEEADNEETEDEDEENIENIWYFNRRRSLE